MSLLQLRLHPYSFTHHPLKDYLQSHWPSHTLSWPKNFYILHTCVIAPFGWYSRYLLLSTHFRPWFQWPLSAWVVKWRKTFLMMNLCEHGNLDNSKLSCSNELKPLRVSFSDKWNLTVPKMSSWHLPSCPDANYPISLYL